jgi:hypothetical protein
MLYLSEILLQHHELVSFEELIPLVKEGAQRGGGIHGGVKYETTYIARGASARSAHEIP